MTDPFSIVIICKDAAATIGRTLQSIEGMSGDVVVYDNGSTDETIKLVQQFKAQLYTGAWLGFGPTRQKAVSFAKNSWILFVDADEELTPALRDEIMQLRPANKNQVFAILLHHHIGINELNRGEWQHDYRIRLYNKNTAHWNNRSIHEKLLLQPNTQVQKLKNKMLHYPALSIIAFEKKMDNYALLTAKQFQLEGRKAGWIKKNISPAFSFVLNYFLRLGFLDGATGYAAASILRRYTAKKYQLLQQLNDGLRQ